MQCIINGQVSTFDQLISIRTKWRAQGKRVIFTNGCFDIIHPGHVRLLNKAKSLGDILIVGLNSDISVKGLKGPLRPIQTQSDRAEIVAAFHAVDVVVLFDELTPNNIIEVLKPDVHVKGGDYEAEGLPEYSLVKSYGGEVFIVQFLEGKSTSIIVEKLQQINKD